MNKRKDPSKDPIISKIKQAIEILKEYSKNSKTKSISKILSLDSLKKIEKLKKNLQSSIKSDSTPTPNKDKDLLSEINIVKLSIKAIIAELQELRELAEEALDKDAIAHEDIVQAVMMELIYKFLPLSGGAMKGDLFMNNFPIKGLKTPSSPEDSHAVNVGFLKAYLLPITNRFNSIENKSNNHDMTLSSLQLQKMSVSGGSFKGNVNMDGNRLLGLPYPKKGSEAVSLEFLQKFAEVKMNPEKKDNTAQDKKNTANSNAPYVLATPSNTLYSGRVVDKNPFSLPLQLIGGGFNGFVWKRGDNDSEGNFPWEALKYTKMKEENDECFVVPEAKNGYELKGTKPGIYDWNFTLQALVPTSQQISHPTIKLQITLNYCPWALANSQFSKTCTLPITLSLKSKTYISGNSYNLIELTPGSANSHRTIMVPPHYSGVSVKLKNYSTDHEESTDLYVIHAFYSLSWRGI
ncbi:hypothetical protein [Chlamydiifrater phoenicopteri]|uniref:hypothetical protein n=1 Tax=Chlamydiifrater phoenicopteri TaxID=2681469 RepID=UPI001BCCA0EB|nr:hypothetical protein [Chlamydiifrater phoenicopteri]